MNWNDYLAAQNAGLNAIAGILLFFAYRAIRSGKRDLHEKLIYGALACSGIFLLSYLVRIGFFGSKSFEGVGWWRTSYFALLISHVLLAISVPVFALRALFLAKKERFAEHRKLNQIGFPIWMYVSVTGVMVYAMLYHFPHLF
jgi:uncharacterized membrane protein YozB (DUF420 family)